MIGGLNIVGQTHEPMVPDLDMQFRANVVVMDVLVTSTTDIHWQVIDSSRSCNAWANGILRIAGSVHSRNDLFGP